MKLKSQNGFSLVEVLLGLIAVALIVFVGFYIYDANQDSDKLLADTSKSRTADKKDSKSNQYMEIKELDVKLKLNGSLSDVNYVKPSEERPQTVTFTSQKFTKAVRECNSEASATEEVQFADLTRYEGTHDANAEPNDYFADFVKQFPDFYLEYGVPDGGFCRDGGESASKAAEAVFMKINNSLKQAAQNAEQL